MKRYAFLLIVLFNLFQKNLNAQSNYEDVVYLKNGSVVHGIIIEQVPNETIKIKSGSNVFVFKYSEIQKITKEEISSQGAKTLSDVKYDESDLKEYLIKKLNTESKGNLIYVGFQKSDGVSKVINGQDFYQIWFTFSFKPVKTIYKAGNSELNAFMAGGLWKTFKVDLNEVGGYDAILLQNADQKPYMANEVIKLYGSAELSRTEKQWYINSLSFYKEEMLADLSGISISLSLPNITQDVGQFFELNDIPILGNSLIYYKPISAISSNIISDFSKGIIYKCFNGYKRGKVITSDQYYSESGEKWIVSMSIDKAENSIKSGKLLIGNQTYSGYECEISLLVTMSKVDDPTMSYSERISVTSGTPTDNKSEAKAIEIALVKFEEEIQKLLLKYSTYQANVISIIEVDKKGAPNEITLDNAQYISFDFPIYFFIIKPENLYMNQNKALTFTSVIATCVYKKKQDGMIICKILSGEQNLSSHFTLGTKLIAVSTVTRPRDVD